MLENAKDRASIYRLEWMSLPAALNNQMQITSVRRLQARQPTVTDAIAWETRKAEGRPVCPR
jgi:hypothetical protein